MKTSHLLFVSFLTLLSHTSAQSDTLRTANLGSCQLDSGQFIAPCQLTYRTAGTLNPDKSNAILWPTWFTGHSADLTSNAGPGKYVDTNRFFVIFVDSFGNGLSSSPSNSPKQPRLKFPRFTIRDMVRAQHRLVTEVLSIPKLHAVMGISMGGMQTFEWAATYPDFVDRFIPIVGTPQLTASDITLWTAQANAIRLHRDFRNGNYKSRDILRIVHPIHQFALTTPEDLASKHSRADIDKFLADGTQQLLNKMDANDYLRQLEAMLSHDITHSSAPLDSLKNKLPNKMLIIVAPRDAMVNPIPATQLSPILGAQLLQLDTLCGHLATSCQSKPMQQAIQSFLEAN